MTIQVREVDLPACRVTAALGRPCPFCGAEPGLAVKRANFWLVGCENDDCRVNPQAGSNTSQAEAWRDWNARVASETERKLLAALREVLDWTKDDADLATFDTEFRLKNFADTVKNRTDWLRATIAKAEGQS